MSRERGEGDLHIVEEEMEVSLGHHFTDIVDEGFGERTAESDVGGDGGCMRVLALDVGLKDGVVVGGEAADDVEAEDVACHPVVD